MPAPYYICDEAQAYLVDEGLVQLPADTGDLPPCYSNKRSPLPEPTDSVPVLCGLREVGDIDQPSYWTGWRQKVIRLTVRAQAANDALRLIEDIRGVWDNLMKSTMGDLEVLWVRLYIATQEIPTADKTYFNFQTDYQFMVRTRALNEGT